MARPVRRLLAACAVLALAPFGAAAEGTMLALRAHGAAQALRPASPEDDAARAVRRGRDYVALELGTLYMPLPAGTQAAEGCEVAVGVELAGAHPRGDPLRIVLGLARAGEGGAFLHDRQIGPAFVYRGQPIMLALRFRLLSGSDLAAARGLLNATNDLFRRLDAGDTSAVEGARKAFTQLFEVVGAGGAQWERRIALRPCDETAEAAALDACLAAARSVHLELPPRPALEKLRVRAEELPAALVLRGGRLLVARDESEYRASAYAVLGAERHRRAPRLPPEVSALFASARRDGARGAPQAALATLSRIPPLLADAPLTQGEKNLLRAQVDAAAAELRAELSSKQRGGRAAALEAWLRAGAALRRIPSDFAELLSHADLQALAWELEDVARRADGLRGDLGGAAPAAAARAIADFRHAAEEAKLGEREELAGPRRRLALRDGPLAPRGASAEIPKLPSVGGLPVATPRLSLAAPAPVARAYERALQAEALGPPAATAAAWGELARKAGENPYRELAGSRRDSWATFADRQAAALRARAEACESLRSAAAGSGRRLGARLRGFAERHGRGELTACLKRSLAMSLTTLHRSCAEREADACRALGALYADAAPELAPRAGRLFAEACERGDLDSCDELGDFLYVGRGGQARDRRRAAELYQKACAGGVAGGCLSQAAVLYRGEGAARDPTRSVALARKLCDAGELGGCGHLGVAHYEGSGVATDPAIAEQALRHACAGGHATSCFNLGSLHQEGKRVPRDPEYATRLYRKACEGGAFVACSELAHRSPPPDDAPALLRKACEGGEPDGCAALAVRAFRAKDYARAAELSQPWCDSGDPNACYNLGVLHRRGWGVARDDRRAQALFQRSCDGGKVAGCTQLGVLRARPGAGAADLAAAFSLFQQACVGGDPRGCLNLGAAYEKGRGTGRDPLLAERRFEQACQAGLIHGCSRLALLLHGERKGRAADPARAAVFFRMACEKGNRISCVMLALHYEKEGGLKDPRARALFEQTCARGEPLACTALAFTLRKEGGSVAKRRAERLLQEACEKGSSSACTELGRGTAREWKREGPRLRKNLERACSLGDALGCELYAQALWRGAGGPRDAARAASVREGACAKGFAQSCKALGFQLGTGQGVARDVGRARELAEGACEKRVADACWNAAMIHRGELGGSRDPSRAAAYFEKGCNLGDPRACFELAVHVAHGAGVARDFPRTASLLDKSCAAGNGRACFDLAAGLLRPRSPLPRDPARARQLLEKGCAARDASSCDELAHLLAEGAFGKREVGRARKLLREACRYGDAAACKEK